MILEAREVQLSKKDRKVLEACCRSPVTLQRDLKRARIVLLAAAGRSTRSIAKEVGVQPRIVSLWRHRYADHGLEGLRDMPRPGKQPIYTKATDKRILRLLDKHRAGFTNEGSHDLCPHHRPNFIRGSRQRCRPNYCWDGRGKYLPVYGRCQAVCLNEKFALANYSQIVRDWP